MQANRIDTTPTLISSRTSSCSAVNIRSSTSCNGVPNIRDACAAAKTAFADVEWFCRYCELNVAREMSSGSILSSVSVKTGPLGDGIGSGIVEAVSEIY